MCDTKTLYVFGLLAPAEKGADRHSAGKSIRRPTIRVMPTNCATNDKPCGILHPLLAMVLRQLLFPVSREIAQATINSNDRSQGRS
jgi:hypothetical protein